MTSPANFIKDEVQVLIETQIKTFGQRAPLTDSQLAEFRERCQKITTLCRELNQIDSKIVMQRRSAKAA
jgi:hypothetical protein